MYCLEVCRYKIPCRGLALLPFLEYDAVMWTEGSLDYHAVL